MSKPLLTKSTARYLGMSSAFMSTSTASAFGAACVGDGLCFVRLAIRGGGDSPGCCVLKVCRLANSCCCLGDWAVGLGAAAKYSRIQSWAVLGLLSKLLARSSSSFLNSWLSERMSVSSSLSTRAHSSISCSRLKTCCATQAHTQARRQYCITYAGRAMRQHLLTYVHQQFVHIMRCQSVV